MSELKARGTQDILIAVVDGLKGFPEAIESVFPEAEIQTCIVGLLKNPMRQWPIGRRFAKDRSLQEVEQQGTRKRRAA